MPEWQELLRSLDVEMKANQHTDLGGGFKYFLFSPLFGEDSHFD